MARYKRKIKLIKPRFQLKLTMVFVGFSALSLLLQFVLFTSSLTEAALVLPQDGAILMEQTSALLMKVILTSCLLFLPLIFMVGILTTFKIAGPLYHFEQFLNAVHRGEKPADCKLRSGDDLHDFCDLLNRVTAPLRVKDRALPEAGDLDEIPSIVSEAPAEVPSGLEPTDARTA
ncbi:MAG: hypothetical protein E2O39_16830 [Planctomycetota bacterium]|nr:MAG: hypothetical protein E2O39_16830 [Planctomycetota bacterium]